jgi:hypothetical protein
MDKVYFILFGSGSKYIEDKEKWIKYYKRNMILMASLIVIVAILFGFGLALV